MWENLPGSGSVYYTDNASAEVLANLGLYPIQSPGAQWILNSPAVARAVIHGRTDTIIEAADNSPATPYVSSIRVNGSAYPSQFISGETFTKRSNTLTFGMTAKPSRIARMYITGTNGEVVSASTDKSTYLRFRNNPLGGWSQAQVSVARPPVAVSVNGTALPRSDWAYSPGEQLLALKGLPAGTVLVQFHPTWPRGAPRSIRAPGPAIIPGEDGWKSAGISLPHAENDPSRCCANLTAPFDFLAAVPTAEGGRFP
jgi:hypothetical protein